MLVPPRGSPPIFRTEAIHEHKSKVRSVAQYWERAAEFEALAVTASVDGLRKRFSDIAACYRLLAKSENGWLAGMRLKANRVLATTCLSKATCSLLGMEAPPNP